MRSLKLGAVVAGAFCLFLILGLNVFARTSPELGREETNKEQLNYVPGEIIVKFKKDKINLEKSGADQKIRSFSDNAGLLEKTNIKKSNISLFKMADKKDSYREAIDEKKLFEKIAELKNDSNVEYAQPNFQYYPSSIDADDTYKTNLWALDNTGQTVDGVTGSSDADLDAPEAWATNAGDDNSVIVTVIDTGVAYNHPDLLSNMWDGTNCKDENGNALGNCNHGYDYEDADKTPLPSYSAHGTHVAGTIAAVKNNSKGIIGVAPHAKIMAIKSSLTTFSNIRSINFAEQNGAKIINASWGSYGTTSEYFDVALYDAIADFPGLFISAAGNSGYNHEDGVDDHKSYPDGFKITTPVGPGLGNIIAVAATDQNDVLASWSDYGATTVDVGAPGVNIYSTVPQESTVLSEPFTSVTPPAVPVGWVKGGTGNNWATYSLGGGWGNVLYGDLYVPYADNANSTITSPTYDLSSSGANMSFWAACDTEYTSTDWRDYMALEFSGDGSTFTELPTVRFDEWQLDYFNNEDPKSGVGSSIYHFQNISIPSQYLTSNFKFQFRWVTNGSDSDYDGCLVDDVTIAKFSDGLDEHYSFMDGTSVAAPQVSGLAALLWGANSNLTKEEIKNAIVNTGDAKASLSGKTVSGKRINAKSAMDQIVTLFAATPTASPAGGTYTSSQSVELSSPGSDIIFYTLDGSDPTYSSIQYHEGEPINISDTTTIKAMAVKSGLADSDVMSESYTIAPSTPLYRFYNKINDQHFFTRDEDEKNNIINNLSYWWNYEGIAFYAYADQESNTVPLYRFYNKINDQHFFTRDEDEKNNIINNLSYWWNYEGIAFYAYADQESNTVPLYRFYNKINDQHFFTRDENEKNNIINNLSYWWNYEGIAFYAYADQE